MNVLAKPLAQTGLFGNDRQSLLYLLLLREGPLGAEKLRALSGLHRETIQRELKKMQAAGTIHIEHHGRNKKARAVSVDALSEHIEKTRDSFTHLLQPLLTAEANQKKPKIEVYTGNHAFALLQLKLIRTAPPGQTIKVLSAQPKAWIESMIETRKLSNFENLRLQNKSVFRLMCFSKYRGQVESNNREYFTGQPETLKRKYRYVETELAAPLQIQIWYDKVLISLFESSPSAHILIQSNSIVAAMNAYFEVLWGHAK